MNTIMFLISIFTLSLWVPEIFVYPGVLHISVGIVSLIIGIGVLFWRIRHVVTKDKFKFLRKALLISTILASGISFVLIVIEQSTYTNYVFSHFHVHIRPLVYASVCSLFFLVATLPNISFVKHWRKIVFYLSLYISFIFILIGTFPNDFLYVLSKEDSVLGYVQVFFLLCAIAAATRGAINHTSWKRVVFIAFIVLCIFLAGEEISWGQRIFNIQSSDYFMSNNAQKEITIHNLSSIGYSSITLSYIGIGVIFTYGWLLRKIRSSHKIIKDIVAFVPRWYTGFYFYPILIYNIYTSLFDHTIGNLAEPTELMMYLGFFMYAITIAYDLE